jgi:hypothetical protein
VIRRRENIADVVQQSADDCLLVSAVALRACRRLQAVFEPGDLIRGWAVHGAQPTEHAIRYRIDIGSFMRKHEIVIRPGAMLHRGKSNFFSIRHEPLPVTATRDD